MRPARLATVAQAAHYIRVSTRTVRYWAEQGRITLYPAALGGLDAVSLNDVDKLVTRIDLPPVTASDDGVPSASRDLPGPATPTARSCRRAAPPHTEGAPS